MDKKIRKILNSKFYIIHFRRSRAGFTLIELLVVISIIGILAAFLLVNFLGVRKRARDTQRKSDLRQIKTALALYHSIWGEYPGSSLGLRVVGCGDGNEPSECGWGEAWQRKGVVYMKTLPQDPIYNPAVSSPPTYNYYETADPQDFCLWATLENKSDQDAAQSQTRCTDACGELGLGSNVYAVCAD